MRQLLVESGKEAVSYKSFWPNKNQFAFILTHDVETAEGQAFVRRVADMEENLGFRSSFNFVLERYPLDFKLIEELKVRGFEVGCHGLKHDGKLFSTKKEFIKRAAIINQHLREYGIVGFRAPLTHRNPEWMQALEIKYDLSFFDTDPFEPIPGGVMSIWPIFYWALRGIAVYAGARLYPDCCAGRNLSTIMVGKSRLYRKISWNGPAKLTSRLPEDQKNLGCVS